MHTELVSYQESHDPWISEEDMIWELWMRGDLEFLLWPQQLPIWQHLQNLPIGIVEFIILCARQFGKCLAKGTDVLTPYGPIPIEQLKVGDIVYGYNKDGTISETKVLKVFEHGIKTVWDMESRGKAIVSATPEHRWLSRWQIGKETDRHHYRYEQEQTTDQIINGRARKVARAFVKIPCGKIHEPHAYALGALFGDGCGKQGKRRIAISSENDLIPKRVGKILGAEHVYSDGHNHTWYISSVPKGTREDGNIQTSRQIHCSYYDSWIKDRLSREKTFDWDTINNWDRPSLLAFMAGLIDTDGSVVHTKCGTLNIRFSNTNKPLAELFAKLFYKLWQLKPGITISRKIEYTVNIMNNRASVAALLELDQYLVTPRKKWKPEYADLNFYNSLPDRIGLKKSGEREVETYDIMVDNDTHLYVLANEGLITHNSTIGIIYALSEAIKNRDCCILIMGPDTRQTKDIVAPKMRFLTRTAPPGLIRQMKAENRYHVYHDLNPRASDYTEIVIGGMNESSSSHRGKTVHKILIEEIVDVHEDDYLTCLESDLGPALAHSKSGKIVYLTTLPKYPNHPFITKTMPKAKLNNALAVYTIDENIALDEQQRANLIELVGGVGSVGYRRELMCEVVRDDKLVCLPDFSALYNVAIFQLPLEAKLCVTIDWGGVRDKTCAVLHTYDYLSDLDLFWDERVFDPNTSTATIVKECLEMEALFRIHARYIDAPPQIAMVDLLQTHKYPAVLPDKPDWKASLNTLNVRFQQRKALIHPRCKFLIVSAESGILNKNKTDFDRNSILGHMDGVAAMMYAVRMQDRTNPYNNPYAESAALLNMPQHAISDSQHTPQHKEAEIEYEGVAIRGFGQFKRSG